MKNQLLKLSLLFVPTALIAGEMGVVIDPGKVWSGVYGGGNIGGIFNHASIDAQHIALSNEYGVCSNNVGFSSFFAGAQAGVLHQFDSNVVLGVEGDFTYNVSQIGISQCDCEFDASIYDQLYLKNRNQGSIRGRVGYAMNHNLLPYFTAGGSFANLGLRYSNEASDSYTASQIQPGYVLGAGLEWAYLAKWSVRLEYYYNSYNELQMNMPTIYTVNDPSGFAHANLYTNNIRAAINYWF